MQNNYATIGNYLDNVLNKESRGWILKRKLSPRINEVKGLPIRIFYPPLSEKKIYLFPASKGAFVRG